MKPKENTHAIAPNEPKKDSPTSSPLPKRAKPSSPPSSSKISQAPTTSDSEQHSGKVSQAPIIGPAIAIANGVHFAKVIGVNDAAANPPISSYSLAEIIAHVHPTRSIHFNYCVDPGFVLDQYPEDECRRAPITLVVGADRESTPRLKKLCAAINEAYESQLEVAAAPLPFPYGTHHSKLSIMESVGEECGAGKSGAGGAMHVMISTANLVQTDWARKTQAFYYWRAPYSGKTQVSSSARGSNSENSGGDEVEKEKSGVLESKFRDDLVEYLKRAYPVGSPARAKIEYWLARLDASSGVDFGGNNDRLVWTHPARVPLADAQRLGHMRLRALLREHFSPAELSSHATFIAQFSSIGSVGAKPEQWLCSEFLTSLAGGQHPKATNPSQRLNAHLRLIFPTAEQVRLSLEGFAAGGSLPHSDATYKKQPYLRDFLHQWRSERLGRSRAMPHVKSYTALDKKTGSAQWLLLTSANLSQSAWGKLEKGGTQLFCRSYELGVMLWKEPGKTLPLPYDLPLTPYVAGDEPFVWDRLYSKKDAWGRRGAADE